MYKRIGLFALLCSVTLAHAAETDKRPIQFAVAEQNDGKSIAQVIGVCDGSNDAKEMHCALTRLWVSLASDIDQKVYKIPADRCVVSLTRGERLTFKQTAPQTWTAASEPDILCRSVTTYVLNRTDIFTHLTATEVEGPGNFGIQCTAGKQTVREYGLSSKDTALPCNGLIPGLSPGLD